MRGYRDINLRALRLLGPGGILVTCSCSHHVSEAALLEVVAQASLDTGRMLRVLERRTQAQDHPISFDGTGNALSKVSDFTGALADVNVARADIKMRLQDAGFMAAPRQGWGARVRRIFISAPDDIDRLLEHL